MKSCAGAQLKTPTAFDAASDSERGSGRGGVTERKAAKAKTIVCTRN